MLLCLHSKGSDATREAKLNTKRTQKLEQIMMKNKRNIVLSLLLSGCALTSFAADGDDVLVLYLDGTSHTAKMETVEKITLADRTLTVVGTDGSQTSKPIAEVDKILFGQAATGVTQPSVTRNAEVVVRANGYTFTAEGLGDGVVLALYAQNGALVAQSVAKGGKATIDASQLAKGVYVVKAGDKSLKVVKR